MRLNPKVLNAFKNSSIAVIDDRWHLAAPQMARKDYEQFKKIVNKFSGEWKRSLGVHVFEYDPTADIQTMVESGFAPTWVNNPYSFFPTPHEEVKDMVEVFARLQDRIAPRVAETGAGDGRIVKAVLKACPGANVRYWEIDERNRSLLKGLKATCEGHDFLAPGFEHLNGTFDFVLMNPEFNGKAYQKHIRRAYDLLNSWGELVAIMPVSAVQDKTFRDWMFANGQAHWCHGEHQFEDTAVKYVTVHIQKGVPSKAPHGYADWSTYHCIIALESDAIFHDRMSMIKSEKQLSDLIVDSIDRIVREQCASLCCDSSTLNYLIEHFAKDIELDTPENKQLSLMSLAF